MKRQNEQRCLWVSFNRNSVILDETNNSLETIIFSLKEILGTSKVTRL